MPSTLNRSKRALERALTLRMIGDIAGERRSPALRPGITVGLANACLRRRYRLTDGNRLEEIA